MEHPRGRVRSDGRRRIDGRYPEGDGTLVPVSGGRLVCSVNSSSQKWMNQGTGYDNWGGRSVDGTRKDRPKRGPKTLKDKNDGRICRSKGLQTETSGGRDKRGILPSVEGSVSK